MPSRIIREGILTSRAVNALSDDAEILYRRLMSIVDDYGRFEDDIDVIRARCFPLKLEQWSSTRVADAMQMLCTCVADDELVTRYCVAGKQYLQINNFRQQTRSKPKYPEPPAKQMRSKCVASVHLDGVGVGVVSSESESGERGIEPLGSTPSYRADKAFEKFEAMCREYKSERCPSRHIFESAWAEIVTSEAIEAKVFSGFEAWRKGKDWQCGMVPRFDRWLRDLQFDNPPTPWAKKGEQRAPDPSKADPRLGFGREA